MTQQHPKPVVLCILDGWGHSEDVSHNAIRSARTPAWDALLRECPNSLIATSGLDVGLPDGQMGNSEVGHMSIGSGRIVMQDLPKIDAAVRDGSLAKNPNLLTFIEALKKSGGDCHLMGLASDGGVHAHIRHIIALADAVTKQGVRVWVHAFTDGRDTAPESAKKFIPELEKALSGMKNAAIAVVSGRYYAMDRDNRWERVQLAYDAMVSAAAPKKTSATQAVKDSHAANAADEFIKPVVIGDYKGMKDGDGVLMANFRADRARQLLTTLLDEKFTGFARARHVKFAAALGMVEYSEALNKLLPAMYPPEKLNAILGEVISAAGLKQLRMAETEKYAHVTFFFNGGREDTFPGEERILVPSPKVATYDLKPEMSAPEVTEKLVAAIRSGTFDLIVVNYANTDMVGHTGIEEAARRAVEAVDVALGAVREAVDEVGGVLLITADHGNAETMVDPLTKDRHTQHTTGPVPLVVAGVDDITLANGRLCDIAPTVLGIMGLAQPKEMTGVNLIKA